MLSTLVSLVQAEFANIHYLVFRQPVTLQIPAVLQVSSCGLVVILTDREKMFDIPITLKEVYHISDIREVGCSGAHYYFNQDLTSQMCSVLCNRGVP